jgi:hypothetical protein
MAVVDVNIIVAAGAPIAAAVVVVVIAPNGISGEHADASPHQTRSQPAARIVVGGLIPPRGGIRVIRRPITIRIWRRRWNIGLGAGVACVIITRAIDHGAVVHVGAGVAGGIAHRDSVVSGVINLDIFRVVVGIAG